MLPAMRRDLMRTPYKLGGRRIGDGIDCLGVVLHIAAARGLPAVDPWRNILRAWARGRFDATGFPPGWERIELGDIRDGDVLIFYGSHPWAAIVDDGHVWTADAHLGVYCRPLMRWHREPAEVWRFQP